MHSLISIQFYFMIEIIMILFVPYNFQVLSFNNLVGSKFKKYELQFSQ